MDEFKKVFLVVLSLMFGIVLFISDDINYINNNYVSSDYVAVIFTKEDVYDDGSRVVVYDDLTLDELASKLDRNFNNELSGKGYLYASYSLEKGVDPYLAAAISLEETGCKWNCSSLVKYCNNVGGMIGYGCNGYSRWNSLDEGIMAFIDNISINYVSYGLTTADAMNSKYAENPLWSVNVNRYIDIIKNN